MTEFSVFARSDLGAFALFIPLPLTKFKCSRMSFGERPQVGYRAKKNASTQKRQRHF
ncbi:MAG: hypothetical protein KGK16_12840 [Bradyrhizobium sp.]|nr:hypothetical protein [Bradyrhizobium sp.]